MRAEDECWSLPSTRSQKAKRAQITFRSFDRHDPRHGFCRWVKRMASPFNWRRSLTAPTKLLEM